MKSQNELRRILELREIALALIKARGRNQGSGAFKKTIATHAGVRISYWPQRRRLRESASAGPGLAKGVELTDVKLPRLLSIDYKSPEMFGRVMILGHPETRSNTMTHSNDHDPSCSHQIIERPHGCRVLRSR